MGAVCERAFGVDVVSGFAPGAFEVEDCFAYAEGDCVELNGGEGLDPGVHVVWGAGWGIDVPVPLRVGFSWFLLALDVESSDGVDDPFGGVVLPHN